MEALETTKYTLKLSLSLSQQSLILIEMDFTVPL